MLNRYIGFSFCVILLSCSVLNAQNRSRFIDTVFSVSSDSALINCDFGFLSNIIKDKKYVFLGESSHQIAEQYFIKTSLVKFLHEELGFNVLVFENKIGEASCSNVIKILDVSDKECVSYLNSYFPCNEMLPLINYLRHSNIFTTGIDLWLSSPDKIFPSFRKYYHFSDSLIYMDSVYFSTLHKLNNGGKTDTSYLKKVKELNPILKIMWAKELEEIQKLDCSNNPVNKCFVRSMYMRQYYYEWMNTGRMSISIRDSVMAENFFWMIENVFPEDKVIVWAHNGHICKKNAQFVQDVESNGATDLYGNFGNRASGKIRDQLYVIGIFSSKGKFGNNEKSFRIKHNGRRTLVKKLSQKGDVVFYNLSATNDSNAPKKQIIDSYSKQKVFPNDLYDGIIVINNANPITPLK